MPPSSTSFPQDTSCMPPSRLAALLVLFSLPCACRSHQSEAELARRAKERQHLQSEVDASVSAFRSRQLDFQRRRENIPVPLLEYPVPGGTLSFLDFKACLPGNSVARGFRTPNLLTGTILNNTDRAYFAPEFSIQAIAPDDSVFGTASIAFQAVIIESGGELKVRIPEDGRAIGTLSLLDHSLGGAILSKCLIIDVRAHYPIFCSVSLVGETSPLTSDDDLLKAHFTLEMNALALRLTNKSAFPLSIPWDNASFVDLDGTSCRVIHSGIPFSENHRPQTPSTVPPGATLNERVLPISKLRREASGEWVIDPLLPPTSVAAPYLQGRCFELFLPLTLPTGSDNRSFTFQVVDVHPYK